MNDPTEKIRKLMVNEINTHSQTREDLEAQYAQVWDTQELQRDFTVLGFLAPFVMVDRKSDGAHGSIMFQHSPRFYFDFRID